MIEFFLIFFVSVWLLFLLLSFAVSAIKEFKRIRRQARIEELKGFYKWKEN